MSSNPQAEETLSKLNYCLDKGNLILIDQNCTDILKNQKMQLQSDYGVAVYPKKGTIMIKNGDDQKYCRILKDLFDLKQEIPMDTFKNHMKPEMLNSYKISRTPLKKIVSNPTLSMFCPNDLSSDDFQPQLINSRRKSAYDVNDNLFNDNNIINNINKVPEGKVGSLISPLINGLPRVKGLPKDHNSANSSSYRRTKRSNTDVSDGVKDWSPKKQNRTVRNYGPVNPKKKYVAKSRSESIIPQINNIRDSMIVPQSSSVTSSDSICDELIINFEAQKVLVIGSQKKMKKLKEDIADLLGLSATSLITNILFN